MYPRPADESEREIALSLFFGRQDEPERTYRIRNALEMIARGALDPTGLLILPGESTPGGVIICQAVPGRGGLIWPPVLIPGLDAPHLEDRLISAALQVLKNSGARVIQCLLPDNEPLRGLALVRNDFDRVTGLSYLRHDLVLTASWMGNCQLQFDSYDSIDPVEFHQTLQATYQGTLDCPEINGVRTIDEVIEGHRVQGRFDPATWWLARSANGHPSGILMLQEQEPGLLEVIYMGVLPEARRRGVGREMLGHALCHARLQGAHRLMLTVDDRNLPAWSLYRSLGFEIYDHRQVFLLVSR